jgi:transcriptional regulator with XRE-family HTH domain
MTAVYDPKEFAEWLSDAFRRSPFKSWRELAGRIGTSVSTLTRYAGAKPQYLTSKPSQPSPDLVIKLAEVFEADINAALEKAGHASASEASTTSIDITKDIRIILKRSDISEDDLEEYERAVATAVAIAEQRIAEKRKQQA